MNSYQHNRLSFCKIHVTNVFTFNVRVFCILVSCIYKVKMKWRWMFEIQTTQIWQCLERRINNRILQVLNGTGPVDWGRKRPCIRCFGAFGYSSKRSNSLKMSNSVTKLMITVRSDWRKVYMIQNVGTIRKRRFFIFWSDPSIDHT